MQTLRETARERMKGFCSLCATCDGRACAGKVPGMGGALTGSSFTANYKALAETQINMRLVHEAATQDVSFDFFGHQLATPIMNGPIASCNTNCGPYDDAAFEEDLMLGVAKAGSIGWIGDPIKPDAFTNGCEAMRKVGRGVVIVKPHADSAQIKMRFEQAKEAGAIAYGLDLDGAGIPAMKLLGYPAAPKSIAELRELRAIMPDKPFIIKGIMTPDDALRCAEAGVSCIVVSNHGGRVLDGTPGVAAVLPAIKRAIGAEMMILADGAVRSGVDVLKMIALGANGVLIGRPACWGVYGGGAEGVHLIIQHYTDQLKQAMLLTGCANLSQIDWRVLHRG